MLNSEHNFYSFVIEISSATLVDLHLTALGTHVLCFAVNYFPCSTIKIISWLLFIPTISSPVYVF